MTITEVILLLQLILDVISLTIMVTNTNIKTEKKAA
ncbi:hypothetical protein Toce_0442 [Thermosediminibacter oceani DSM 16646]|uniref:Uncharacterized protein n=1 Tax=Thermosediminibacter oceani (strain ATCC BAA-1034 / DSM 16646 / JW/IW-1228P) TaxID=555079 RepID=D9S1E2_THEOJ|nr:hypothetical protein Toce_0442 [Thermosediminibacter oceani DSM 16646]